MSTSTLALSLAGNFEAGTAIWAGIVGAVAMLAVIYMGMASGMTSITCCGLSARWLYRTDPTVSSTGSD